MKKESIIVSTSFILLAIIVLTGVLLLFNHASYAAETYKSEFTLSQGVMGDEPATIKATSGSTVIEVTPFFESNSASTSDFLQTTVPTYMIKYKDDVTAGEEYEQVLSFVDTGLLYLLKLSTTISNQYYTQVMSDNYLGNGHYGGVAPSLSAKYPTNYGFIYDSATLEFPESSGSDGSNETGIVYSFGTVKDFKLTALETYATQVAIWLYLDETRDADDWDSSSIPAADLAAMKGDVTIEWNGETIFTGNFYEKYLKKPIEDAIDYEVNDNLVLSLASDNLTLKDNAYRTDAFSVTSTNNTFNRYYVTLFGVEDAYVVDEEGNTVPEIDSFAKDKKFYVEIPADKMSSETSKLYVFADGLFDEKVVNATYYMSDSHHILLGVTSHQYRTDSYAIVDLIKIPDTKMSINMLLLVVGVSILVIGLGIITFNVTRKREQQ